MGPLFIALQRLMSSPVAQNAFSRLRAPEVLAKFSAAPWSRMLPAAADESTYMGAASRNLASRPLYSSYLRDLAVRRPDLMSAGPQEISQSPAAASDFIRLLKFMSDYATPMAP